MAGALFRVAHRNGERLVRFAPTRDRRRGVDRRGIEGMRKGDPPVGGHLDQARLLARRKRRHIDELHVRTCGRRSTQQRVTALGRQRADAGAHETEHILGHGQRRPARTVGDQSGDLEAVERAAPTRFGDPHERRPNEMSGQDVPRRSGATRPPRAAPDRAVRAVRPRRRRGDRSSSRAATAPPSGADREDDEAQTRSRHWTTDRATGRRRSQPRPRSWPTGLAPASRTRCRAAFAPAAGKPPREEARHRSPAPEVPAGGQQPRAAPQRASRRGLRTRASPQPQPAGR